MVRRQLRVHKSARSKPTCEVGPKLTSEMTRPHSQTWPFDTGTSLRKLYERILPATTDMDSTSDVHKRQKREDEDMLAKNHPAAPATNPPGDMQQEFSPELLRLCAPPHD